MLTAYNKKVKYNTIKDYGKFLGFNGYSNLNIFPEYLPSSANIIQYYYKDDVTNAFDDTCQIYLQCTYNEEDFQSEKKRLSAVSEKYKDQIHTAWTNEEDYIFPAIVTIDNNNFCHEYCLLDSRNNRIYYIFLQFEYRSNLQFDKKLLPKGFKNPDESLGSEEEGQSIYLFKMDGGTSYGTYGKWRKK